ncbi:MAG TPA: biopolymer transporter ExbD [Polyangiaceae bacterium]|jgi:biopolymer transport protein TolR|nr:biopolymer transporter ExbD [Polyangiaceae bacterium]
MKHRKKIAVKPVGAINTDINVTPLVDVVLVLLIIFMVVTPLLEKDIAVKTPSTEKVEVQTEVPPDQIIIYVDSRGELRLNAESIAQGQLVGKLKPLLENKQPADRIVFVVADDKLNYAKFVTVLDGTKEAGAKTLGFATDAPDPAMFQ